MSGIYQYHNRCTIIQIITGIEELMSGSGRMGVPVAIVLGLLKK